MRLLRELCKYLRVHGYEVKVQATHDLPLIKKRYSVPATLEGCHTTLVGGYVVEGHVPVKSLAKLLAQRPKITGISLPGMPTGSPGMMGPKTEPFKSTPSTRRTARRFTRLSNKARRAPCCAERITRHTQIRSVAELDASPRIVDGGATPFADRKC